MLIKNASDQTVYLHGHKSRQPWEGREIKDKQEQVRLLRCPNLRQYKMVEEKKNNRSKKKSK